MTLRHATSSDLDAITALGLSALPDDPIWPYRFPRAQQHPDDHYKFSRIRFSEYLDNAEAGTYAAVVVEAPSKEDASVTQIIAMSLWVLPGYHLKDPSQPLGTFLQSHWPSRIRQTSLIHLYTSSLSSHQASLRSPRETRRGSGKDVRV